MFYIPDTLAAVDALMLINIIIVVCNALASFLGAKKGSKSQ